MKPVSQITRKDIEKIKVISFDCDGVTIAEGTEIRERGNELMVRTASLEDRIAAKLERLKKRFFLVFSSGRSLLYLSRMYEKILWDRVALQAEIGLFTLYQGMVLQQEAFTPEFLEKSTRIKKAIRELSETDKNILGFEPKQFLVTVHCQKEDQAVIRLVNDHDPENEYYCLWSGEAYDIGPKVFTKGSGLRLLVKRMGLSMENLLAVGNDPNDSEMIRAAGIGITTDPENLAEGVDFVTERKLHLGGEEVIDQLLALING